MIYNLRIEGHRPVALEEALPEIKRAITSETCQKVAKVGLALVLLIALAVGLGCSRVRVTPATIPLAALFTLVYVGGMAFVAKRMGESREADRIHARGELMLDELRTHYKRAIVGMNLEQLATFLDNRDTQEDLPNGLQSFVRHGVMTEAQARNIEGCIAEDQRLLGLMDRSINQPGISNREQTVEAFGRQRVGVLETYRATQAELRAQWAL